MMLEAWTWFSKQVLFVSVWILKHHYLKEKGASPAEFR